MLVSDSEGNEWRISDGNDQGSVCRFSVRDFLRRTKSVAVEEQK
jgi:hypothetical protein